MADAYSYAKTNMAGYNNNLNSRLIPSANLTDDGLASYGLYSKEIINNAKFNNYSRFGRVLDPYGRLNDTREYLFFVKPNLHILYTGIEDGDPEYSANGLTLNPELNNNRYFRDLIYRRPDVVRSLVKNAPGTTANDPFCHLLSFTVNSSLDVPGTEFSTMDVPGNIFGTSYEYLGNTESSDENPTFSLEFLDSKTLDTYHFFRAYSEYQNERKSGLVSPPSRSYWQYKRLHNTMGVYKFLVDEDMETIIYYAYFWGVMPTSVPREAFSDPSFPEGLTFSVNFKAAFFEDLDPRILESFNTLMSPLVTDKDNWLPVMYQSYATDNINGRTHSYKANLDNMNTTIVDANGNPINNKYRVGGSDRINGQLPKAALVDDRILNNEKPKYRLRWYA